MHKYQRKALKYAMLKDVNSSTTSPRIGVALGGGSARGFAHIGALASLEKHGLTPDVVAGTSFGAIIGALYASGKSTEEIQEVANSFRKRDMPSIIDFGLHRAALFSGDKLETFLETLVEGRHFSDLEREFVVVTTDLDTGESVTLSEGPLAPALRASSAMPGVFSPVEIDGRRLVDGGLGSPIPLDTLSELEVDIAIGIGAGLECSESAAIRFAQRCLETEWGQRLYKGLRDGPGEHPLQLLGRSFAHSMTAWQTDMTLDEDALHVHTKPPINWFNFHRAAEAIEAGEAALEQFVPKIRSAVEAFHDSEVEEPDVITVKTQ